MNVKGIVFFDFDGTLVDEQIQMYQPSIETVNAIKRLQDNGYKAILNTGRSRCYVPNMPIQFDGYLTCNGAYSEVEGNVIDSTQFDKEILIEMMDFLEANDFSYAVERPYNCLCNDINNETMSRMLDEFHFRQNAFIQMKDKEKAILEPVYKLLVVFPDRAYIPKFHAHFTDRVQFVPHHTAYYGDITPKGVTKSDGISPAAEYYHVALENTYAFGDGANDVTMLSYVGHGIAMERHAKELDAVKEFTTKSVLEEGIAYGLKHYGLI